MLSSEEILEQAARDGSIDIAEWPRVLESLLQRLHDIIHNEFPLPSLPLPAPLPSSIDPEVVASTPPAGLSSDVRPKDEELPDADAENDPPPNSQSSTKENDEPMDIPRPPIPGFEPNDIPQPGQPPDSMDMPPGTLPPDILSIYERSRKVLRQEFGHSPPYTIQRLAELILYPKRHYRFLPPYMRALDRIISVSSPVSEFPLPALRSSIHSGFLTNGDSGRLNGMSERDELGSDESLGGALLTPIPWLRANSVANLASQNSQGESEFRSESTETVEGPNGAGSIETVSVTVNGVPSATSASHTTPAPASPTLSEQSDASSSTSAESVEANMREQGAVTQGELLRQEQEAGVIPLTTTTSPRRTLMAAGAVAVGRENAPMLNGSSLSASIEEGVVDDIPHARGPEQIGMEDVGLQHHSLDAGLDMEAAVGRGRSKSPQPPLAESTTAATAGPDAMNEDEPVSPRSRPLEAERRNAMDTNADVVVADVDGMTEEDQAQVEAPGDVPGAGAAA